MDDFSKKLSKVDKSVKESFIKRKEFSRKEGEIPCNEINRKVMFGNSPKTKGDFILGEKKKW